MQQVAGVLAAYASPYTLVLHYQAGGQVILPGR
jgi:hypothetical protein